MGNNELAICINYEKDFPTVSARDLHEGLEIKTSFKDWFPRIIEYGFEENKDFCSKMSKSTGGRPAKDYDISVDMAKQICMIQRTNKGMAYRKYFLRIEQSWNTPEAIMARALQLANRTIDSLEHKISSLSSVIEEQKPLVDFASKVSDSSTLIDMGKMAKLLHDEHIPLGRNKLFEWMRSKNILMNNNVPYQKYITGGYFEVKESVFETPYGSKTGITTYITGKGQIYITEKLRAEIRKNIA